MVIHVVLLASMNIAGTIKDATHNCMQPHHSYIYIYTSILARMLLLAAQLCLLSGAKNVSHRSIVAPCMIEKVLRLNWSRDHDFQLHVLIISIWRDQNCY
jgi:hypothetical protein